MNKKWMAVWGCPVSRPVYDMAGWMHDTTVRFNVFMTVSGSALRFHFSNLFGKEQAVITRATVSVDIGDRAIDINRIADITFKGDSCGVIPAGENICSDSVDFKFEAGEKLSVSLYFAEFTQMATAHQNSGDFIEKWFVDGDFTHASDLPREQNAPAAAYPFINTIDALCNNDSYSIICFGDSITAQTWPDRLARRVYSLGIKNVAVVRRGIGGSRVLREYPCTQLYNYGPRGVDRFEREVLSAGVKKVFILHGINDIIHPCGTEFRPFCDLPSADELINGLKYYIDTAHKNGIEAYISPILPFKGWRTYDDERNELRMAVNEWIKNESSADGVLPFEDAVMDKADPLKLFADYDSGDHLHPSGDGAQAMADSIPEKIL